MVQRTYLAMSDVNIIYSERRFSVLLSQKRRNTFYSDAQIEPPPKARTVAKRNSQQARQRTVSSSSARECRIMSQTYLMNK